MGCMKSDHNEPFFTNHVALFLSLILSKRSWIKKITFENEYYGAMKQKLNFFNMMYRRFYAKKVRLCSKRTQCQH